MRKLSKTFLTISAVLSFICAGIFLIVGIIMIAAGAIGAPAIAEAEQGSDVAAAAYLGGMIGGAVVFFFLAVFALVSGIVSNKAKATQAMGNLICAIVFSAISCTWLGVAGGILGLVANSREKNSGVVDAQ